MANDPPPEVQRAAEIVDRWLKNQPGVLAGNPQPQPRPETAAQRFAKLDRSKPPASNLPPWRDPRSAA
jgi:hypothetical protein